MGGRGTYASGKNVPFTYVTIGTVEGVKVLRGIGLKHQLPEEAHSSNAYIKVGKKGEFLMLREYDSKHYLTTEVGFHPEPSLDKSRKPVLHIHFYDRNFKRSDARLLTPQEINKYQKYFQRLLPI